MGGYINAAINGDNSQVQARSIARWNLATNTWTALGDGSDASGNGTIGAVGGIAVKGNEVYAIGGFTTVCSGVANCISANYVARWNKLTNTWSALGSDSGPTGNGLNLVNDNSGGVNDVVVLGNDVYVGGGFEGAYNSNSSSVVTSSIARWNGSSWSAVGSGASATGQGLSNHPGNMLAVGTDLYVAGQFTAANNSETDHVAASGIAKWNGSAWSALGSGLNASDINYGAALTATSTHLYVGGIFGYTGGNITANFGRYRLASPCPAITLSPATLPPAVKGEFYWQPITASGGAAPYSFAVTAGSLPPGMSLLPNGVLRGAPSATGSFNFTIAATVAGGCAGSRGYALRVFCPVIIAPPLRAFPKAGGAAHVNVLAVNSCAWMAASNVSWVTITAGSSGSGRGKVDYTVAANTSGSHRLGTISISGRTFTIIQP